MRGVQAGPRVPWRPRDRKYALSTMLCRRQVGNRMLLEIGQVGADECVDGVETGAAVMADPVPGPAGCPPADGLAGRSGATPEPIRSPSR